MSVQYIVWAIGAAQILRYRRRVRRDLLENNPEAYAALRAGQVQLPS
jgi:hypothetical protein